MTEKTDPLAIYRIGKQGVSTPQKEPDQFSEEDDTENSVDKYRIKPPEKSQYSLKDIHRLQIGAGARAAETIIGAPEETKRGFGALLDLIVGAPTEYLTGKKYPKLREFLKDPNSALGEHREEIEQLERESLAPGELNTSTKYPTSEEIREGITKPASESIFGDKNFLEPKNEFERFGQEVTQDLTRLALPGSGVHSWMGRMGLSLAGNTSKQIAKELGFSPSSQELAKFGTLGILSLAQIGNAPRFAQQYFQQTKAMLPRGVRFNAQPLQNALNRIRNTEWFRGHTTPSTRAAREMIDAIEQRIQNGSINAQQAMTLRENINELAGSLGAFNIERGNRTAHVTRLNEVRDALIEGMESTLGRQYPNWWNTYQDANTAFAITRRSSALGQFISTNYAKPIISDAGKILFGNALAKGAAGVAKIGLAGAALATGSKAIELTNRVFRSRTLRNYYGQVISAATRGDGIAMTKALQKFDEEALKEQKQEKSRKVLYNRSQK
jgi:hypothetical protein